MPATLSTKVAGIFVHGQKNAATREQNGSGVRLTTALIWTFEVAMHRARKEFQDLPCHPCSLLEAQIAKETASPSLAGSLRSGSILRASLFATRQPVVAGLQRRQGRVRSVQSALPVSAAARAGFESVTPGRQFQRETAKCWHGSGSCDCRMCLPRLPI